MQMCLTVGSIKNVMGADGKPDAQGNVTEYSRVTHVKP